MLGKFAAVVMLGFASAASAQLTGTTVDITQSFTGIFATTTTGPHTYGGAPTVYPDPGFPQFTWTASSPAAVPPVGFANSVFCDYTNFALPDFANEMTTITLNNIAVNVAANSARIINGLGAQIGIGTSGGTTINFTIAINDILAGPTPTMTVAWNSKGGTCYADCNLSGGLSVADFGCFQGKYVLGDMYADCNASGGLSVADFGCYQGKYVLGCPP
ncbi:MAG: hypothetical protein ACKVU4_03575 [Phycisphaerales bacterium]